MSAIEQGDDDDTTDIIDHRQGSQEDTHTQRNPLAQQAQHRQGERDVRRHRDCRAIRLGAFATNQKIKQNRDDHTTASGDNRQQCLPERA